MAKKPIEEIVNEAKFGDLVLLYLVNCVQVHAGSFCGEDCAVGFYEHGDKKRIRLNRIQRVANRNRGAVMYEIADLTGYEILRKYVPDPENNSLDEFLVSMEAVEAPPGYKE